MTLFPTQKKSHDRLIINGFVVVVIDVIVLFHVVYSRNK